MPIFGNFRFVNCSSCPRDKLVLSLCNGRARNRRPPFVYRGFIEYDNSGYYTRLGAADFLLCRTKLTHSTFFLDPPIFPRRNTVNIWPIVIPYSACYACNLSSDDVFVEYGIVIARPRTFFINIESRIFVPTFFFFLSLSLS